MDRCIDSFENFPWDGNAEIYNVYTKNNYKVLYTRANTNKCCVFFTSNDLFFPNTVEEMEKRIIKEDRYEWENISRNKLILRTYKKIIFLRDVYKQWYITGINSSIDTIDKVCDMLRKETTGYSVTTCGSSSGGYMAVLVGCLLNAELIFSNSGQFDITEDSIFAKKYIDDAQRNKYFNIKWLVKNNTNNIFYFFPVYSESDVRQYNFIEGIDVNVICFNSFQHGVTMSPMCWIKLLTYENKDLILLCKKYKGMIINQSQLAKDVLSKRDFLYSFVYQLVKKLIRAVKNILLHYLR